MVRRPLATCLALVFIVGIDHDRGTAAAQAGASPTARAAKPAVHVGGRLGRAAGQDCRAHARTGAAMRQAGRLARAREPREPGPEEIKRMSADLDRRLRSGYGVRRPADSAQQIRVPLWVHVIKDGALGVPDSGVRRQVEALNAAYGGRFGGVDTGVRFELKGITHTDNRRWFRDPLGNEAALKAKLRVGGPETLNLFVAQLSELVLGYATYPYWYQEEPGLDGVVIDWRSVPGGPLRRFNRGFTAVHEIGHWLGLLHTFENGCKPPGDLVDDTPPEARATTGCPAKKDTCPAPGEDPIHNFMDYSQDDCMREFTAGQADRIRVMWDAYRRPELAGGGAPPDARVLESR